LDLPLSETAQHQVLGAPPAEQDSTARPLRAWQRRALTRYLTQKPKDFLAVATPGAGKTVFGLRIARRAALGPHDRVDHESSPRPST